MGEYVRYANWELEQKEYARSVSALFLAVCETEADLHIEPGQFSREV